MQRDNVDEMRQFAASSLFLAICALFGSIVLITKYGEQLAQLYQGSDNFPHTTITVRQLAVCRSATTLCASNRDAAGQSYLAALISGRVVKYDDNLKRKISYEIINLKGCGDALFTHASAYTDTEDLRNSESCVLPAGAIRGSMARRTSKTKYEDDYYSIFIAENAISNRQVYQNDKVISVSISEPKTLAATLSSTLSWEFSGNLVQQDLSIDAESTYGIKNFAVYSMTIYLDIRINSRLLNLPGGNFINLKLDNNTDPVSQSILQASSAKCWLHNATVKSRQYFLFCYSYPFISL